MKVIILAYENENHTHCVKWALEEAGYSVACWAGLSWVEPQQASLLLDQQPKMNLARNRVEPGDVIWIRRPDQPLANPKVSDADRKFAGLEYRSFYYCIGYLLEMLPVWCINKFSATRIIHNKAVQLQLARTCGLKIPRTLMSNNPTRIGSFVNQNAGKTIGKGFSPHVWQRDDGVSVTQTFELTPERLPSDEVLTFAPAIYQDMVVKQFDVRMVMMGRHLYSYALHTPRKVLDWRQDSALGNLHVEIIPTPLEIEKKVLAFARKAGICFGSLDFAVDMDGQWWFLEINEQGQFLWLDQLNPQARILEKFCAFITAPQSSAQPLEEREGLFPPFAEYLKFYRSLGENRQATDVAAAVAASPYMSREA